MRKSLAYKIKRKWRDWTVIRQPLGAGPAGVDKVSLAIYLDYEREFAREDAKPSANKGFSSILEILCKYNIKATWNCVGLIGEHYPETINRLIDADQEVASHTYSHIVPFDVSKSKLVSELSHAKTSFLDEFNIDIRGFHSPQDAWSKVLLEILEDHKYVYDIAVERDKSAHNACRLSTFKYKYLKGGKGIIRIPSLCDDWEFISDNILPEDILVSWKAALAKFYHGKTIAVGFHPWVIGQDDARISAFEAFVKSVKSSECVNAYTGSEIVDWYSGKYDARSF